MHDRAPVLAVCGTRPEVVKLVPVITALRASGNRVVLAMTGQHPDLAPLMLNEAGVSPDNALAATTPGLAPAQQLSALLAGVAPVFAAWRPAIALVQGDTVSTLAGALAAAYARVPIAHVEAGLRTHDFAEPHPEELHRTLVAPLAQLHFAPTRLAAAALRREGVPPERIHVTGNSGIDALMATLDRLQQDPGLAAELARRHPYVPGARRPLLLVTVHRRENSGRRLNAIAAALARLAAFCEAEIVLPLHPNPAVQGLLRDKLEGLDGVHLIPPLDHLGMVWMMHHARCLLNDSGGLQEEAPALGLRCLVLRRATERCEALAAGAAELVEIGAESIVSAVRRTLLRPPMKPVLPFGDGRASARIAAIIDDWLADATSRQAAATVP
jgi:UDP-N-acetylglucosamine 2-epimerase (non-hydrolysing)